MPDDTRDDPIDRTATPTTAVAPAAPEDFGLVSVWWGDGKGKTTAAVGMGMRAAGHGYRVHLLQFMKGGAESVDDARGEYAAIDAVPGFSQEHEGHYGWHGALDDSDDDEHEARARAGLERAEDLVAAAAGADLDAPIPLDAPPEMGVHLLLLDEILYAANRGLVPVERVVDLVRGAPDGLELVLTGGHERCAPVCAAADLVTEVRKEKHPFDSGQQARRGTEF